MNYLPVNRPLTEEEIAQRREAARQRLLARTAAAEQRLTQTPEENQSAMKGMLYVQYTRSIATFSPTLYGRRECG